MIIDYLPKNQFFENYVPNVIFVVRFDLLYQYSSLTLKEIMQYWPAVASLLKKKKFSTETCKRVGSEKYGTLFILSDKTPDPGDEKAIEKQDVDFQNWINQIDSAMPDPVYRIDMNSFFGSENKRREFRFMRILNFSDKKFEVYY